MRGGSPGTRETDLLRPMRKVDELHAVVLSGGSAFGLDTASGVVGYLAEQGIGLRAGTAIVPIVSAAILFDLNLVTAEVRPGAAEGCAACLSASVQPMVEGSVGAGTGATIGKALGLEHAVKGGIGSASLRLPSGSVMAAMVAVNAYGGVVDYKTGRTIAGPRREHGPDFYDSVELLLQERHARESLPLANTTIGVIATDASLTKAQVNFLAALSHDGLAMAIRPCHTIRDGDTMFAMSTGRRPEPVDITVLGAAAVEVTAQAVLRAAEAATGLGGVPAIRELKRG